MNSCLLSSNTDHWSTPKSIYNYYVNYLGYFDPCPLHSEFNGLDIEWKANNFVNPPYSCVSKWIDKAIEESKKGRNSILLIPSRTDTKWFKKLCDYGCKVCFICGRLKFGNSNNVAPFGSCFVVLNGLRTTYCIIDRKDLNL